MEQEGISLGDGGKDRASLIKGCGDGDGGGDGEGDGDGVVMVMMIVVAVMEEEGMKRRIEESESVWAMGAEIALKERRAAASV